VNVNFCYGDSIYFILIHITQTERKLDFVNFIQKCLNESVNFMYYISSRYCINV